MFVYSLGSLSVLRVFRRSSRFFSNTVYGMFIECSEVYAIQAAFCHRTAPQSGVGLICLVNRNLDIQS